jgi:hypothetical protein
VSSQRNGMLPTGEKSTATGLLGRWRTQRTGSWRSRSGEAPGVLCGRKLRRLRVALREKSAVADR